MTRKRIFPRSQERGPIEAVRRSAACGAGGMEYQRRREKQGTKQHGARRQEPHHDRLGPVAETSVSTASRVVTNSNRAPTVNSAAELIRLSGGI